MSSTLGDREQVRLTLRPATPVMTRSPGVIQVGLEGPAVRLPDEPAVRRLLAALDRPGGVRLEGDDVPPAVAEALGLLEQHGLLVAVLPSARSADATDLTLRAQFGGDADRRRRLRGEARVAVRADPQTELLLGPLLEAAGLQRVDADDPSAPPHLLVTRGPLDRATLDPLVQASIPHLVVAGSAAGRRVGPFVEPGTTACQRCVDAHESLHDPRHGLLLAQAARAAGERPPPVDPVLDQLVLAWAVRDLQRYVEGDEPSTWSTTVDIGPVRGATEVRWGRHPDCGCAWDAFTLLP